MELHAAGLRRRQNRRTGKDAHGTPFAPPLVEALEPRMLLAVDPTGTVNSLVTNDTTPALSGTLTRGTNDITEVHVIVGGTTYEATTFDQTSWTLADNTISPALGEAIYDVQLWISTGTETGADTTSNELTIDTTPPATPNAPDLQAASDSGVSSSDDITNDSTPTFDITSTDTYFRFYVDGVQNGGDYLTGSTYTTTVLTNGTKLMTIRAVDAAGNVSGESLALSVTIDIVAPATPTRPDLQAASDSGVSSTDNNTNDDTPTFDVTSTDTYFRFYVTGVQNGGNYLTGSSYTTTVLTNGAKVMMIKAVDAAGNLSSYSSVLVVVIDTAAPVAPGAPDLQAASDSGVSDSDNVTNDSTPTFTVTSTGTYFRFFVDGVQNGGDYLSGTSYTVTALADVSGGQFLIKGVDTAGNISASGTALTVTIDTLAPSAPGAPDLQAASDSGVSSTDNITNAETPTFDITSTDTYFRFFVSGVQNGGNYLTGSTYTTDGLGDNTYAMTLAAVDAAGNLSEESSALSVTIDTEQPDVPDAPALQAASDSGVSSSDNITNDDTPTFDVNSTDEYFRFSVNGSAVSGDYESGNSFSLSELSDGPYDMSIAAVDAAGNMSDESLAASVTIDTAAPAAPGAPDLQAASDSGVSSSDNITNDNTPTFNLISTDTYFRFFVSGVQNGSDYEVGTTYTTTVLPDDPAFMTFKAVDAAGNISTASSALSVTIDTAAPAAPGAPDLQAASDSGVSSTDNVTNDNTPTFDLSSTDTYFRFYVDGVQNGGDYLSGSSYTTAALVDVSGGQFLIEGVDAAGNVSASGTALTVTIDTAAPSAPGAPDLQAASDSGVSSTDNITNDSTPTFDVTSTDSYFRFFVSGVQNGGDYLVGTSYATTALTDGATSMTVRAVDVAGNVSADSTALSVTIDTVAPGAPDCPNLQDTSDSGVSDSDGTTNDSTPTFDISGTEPSGYFQFYVDGVQNGGDYLAGDTYTTTTLTDGGKWMTVRGVDAAGNLSDESDGEAVTIDTVAPAAPGAPDLQAASDSGVSGTDDITNDNTPTFTVASTDNYSRFFVDGVQNGSDYLVGGSYTTTTLTDGTGLMTLRAVDIAGNVSADSMALSVTIDTVAPDAPNAPDLQAASDSGVSSTDNITNDSTPTFDVTSTDSYFRFFVEGIQEGGDYLTGTSLTASSLSDGTTSVTIKAVDAAGNVSAESSALSVTIDTIAPAAPGAPDLQAASDSGISSADNYTNDNTPTFDLSSTDTYFRFFVGNVQNGGNYLTGSTYTATALADGLAFATIVAVDAAGNISAASNPLVILIDTVAPPAPGAPDLQATSDSGVSSSDNITNDDTPTFDVTSTDTYFRFYVNGIQVGADYLAGSSYTTPVLADGAKVMRIRAADFAGNLSAMSEVVAVTIDTQNPTSGITTTSQSQGSILMDLQWDADDDPEGDEGIAGVTVYVSTDGVTYDAAFEDLTWSQTSVTYVAQDAAAGSAYRFYSIATDLAGNTEAAPLVPDATITLWDTEVFAIPLSRGRGSYCFYDANGTYVTVSWTGPAGSVVTIERWVNPLRDDPVNPDARSDVRNITIEGSDAASRLTVTTRASRDYPGSDADTIIENVTSNGPLRMIAARAVDLVGDVEIDGSLSSLIMRDTLGEDQAISLGASVNPNDRVQILFGEVSDLSIDSGMAIRQLRVTCWLDDNEEVDLISAPSIERLTVTGDRRALITGDFDASIELSGALVPGASAFGSARVNGSVRGATWTIEGVLNNLIVGRWLDSSRILTTQSIRTVQVGGTRHSDVYAGVSAGISGLPDPNADFSIAQSLGVNSIIDCFKVTGVVTNGDCSTIDSNIAAMCLKTISLQNAEFSNNGTLWGLAGVSTPVRLTHRYAGRTYPYPFSNAADFEVRTANGVPP